MNEQIKAIRFLSIFGIITFVLGAVAGYCTGVGVRSFDVAELTEKYDTATRERDATIERITEDNQRLRDGIERAQARLDAAMARVTRLEEYIGSAGERNQSVITNIDGARQNIEEAIRIVGSYLNE